MRASFSRYTDPLNHPCTIVAAPDGVTVKVVNVNNGMSTTCHNVFGMYVPPGVDIILHTDDFATISDLADAPIVVRVSW